MTVPGLVPEPELLAFVWEISTRFNVVPQQITRHRVAARWHGRVGV
jgi:hypothetical protein